MWKFPLGVISKNLFNAGNQVYVFNQLPTAKESATLWYPFPGKRLQSCPIMYVCAFTVFIRKPHAHSLWALQSKSGLTCNLRISYYLSVINPLHRSHTYHTYAAREGAICCPPDWLSAGAQSLGASWPLKKSSEKAAIWGPHVFRQQICNQQGSLSNMKLSVRM